MGTKIQEFFQNIYAFWLALQKPNKNQTDQVNTTGGTTAVDIMTNLILSRRKTEIRTYYPNPLDPNRKLNAEIHTVSPESAKQIASLMIKTGGTLNWFFASCSYQESQWDPTARNRNLRETNGLETFEGTDWGIGQLSGYQVRTIVDFRNLSDDQIIAHILDPVWSIPHFIGLYINLITWAKQICTPELIAVLDKSDGTFFDPSTPGSPELDKYEAFMATLAYNAGQTGAMNIIADVKAGKPVSDIHGHSVQQWIKQFYPILSNPGK